MSNHVHRKVAKTELLTCAAIMFTVEMLLHAAGGADHRPKWAHVFTPLGFILLALGLI